MKALRRRDSSVLDVLVECLAEQQEANADLIKRIRNGEWLSSTHHTAFPHSLPREATPSPAHCHR